MLKKKQNPRRPCLAAQLAGAQINSKINPPKEKPTHLVPWSEFKRREPNATFPDKLISQNRITIPTIHIIL